jgi:uncharacterized repeat protein (TIGR02543 family)
MSSPGAILGAIVVAFVCLVGMIAFYEPTEDWEQHDVTYELDGGEFLNDPPSRYTVGRYLDVPAPVKEGYTFQGWYLDKELTQYFNGNTKDFTGNIVLYAAWGDNLSGHYVKLSKSGSYSSILNSYEISGTLTFTYLYYDGDKQSYYIRNDDETTYKYRTIGGTTYTDSSSNSYWSGGSDRTMVEKGKETIQTAAGEKECEVYEFSYSGRTAVETQWIGDDWIPYKIVFYESTGFGFRISEKRITYTYVEDGVVELPRDCNVSVYQGYGITVTGNDSPYTIGRTATLTATVTAGMVFSGWYDSSMNLLSDKMTYKFVVGGDMTIYALNKDSLDKTFASDELVDLDREFGIDGGTYVITNTDTLESYEAESTFTFTQGGPYIILTSDKDGNNGYYNAKVTGDADRTFNWKYNRMPYSVTISIDYDDMLYAREYYEESQRMVDSTHKRDATFVTLSYTDEVMSPYMEDLVDKVLEKLRERYSTINETTLLGYLLAFTQYIQYQSDEEYVGPEEYWKFPLETLYDQGGDCEDTSILFAAMAHQAAEKLGMDYEVGLQLLPGHMAGAVKLTSNPRGWTTNPDGYIYAETTTTSYSLGEVPYDMRDYFTSSYYYRTDDSTLVPIA